jgi:hypothetical protein
MSKQPNYRIKRINPGLYWIAGAQHVAFIIGHLNGSKKVVYTINILNKQTKTTAEPPVFAPTLSAAADFARDALQELDRETNHDQTSG